MFDLAPIAQVLAHVPKDVQKNLWKTITTLVGDFAEWPAAWVSGKVDVTKAQAKADVRMIDALSEAATTSAVADPKLVSRAVRHFTDRVVREQENREAVTEEAFEQLKESPPTESAGVIDDDWLDLFSRHAEQRSNPEMRTYFARVLAGEIRRPSSFSPATIEVLARLSTGTAALFRRLCNASFNIPGTALPPYLITAPFGGSPGDNSLNPIGLNYDQLCELQDAGLIQRDLSTWRELPRAVFAMPARIGGVSFRPLGELASPVLPMRVANVNYTAAGRELWSIVDLGRDDVYLANYAEWLRGQFGLTVDFASGDDPPKSG